jgi:signal transduction histidine kinase
MTTTAIAPAPAPVPTRTYEYRVWRVAVGTFFLLLGAAFLLDSAGVFRVTAALFWPLFVISLGAGLLLRRARRLMVEEDRSAQLAVAEERVRIARELHDIVAHGVSLMTIQIAAARRVGSKNQESANESLEAAEQTGRQTLSELEGMLAVLRGADASIGAAAGAGGPNASSSESQDRNPLPRISDIQSLVDAVRQTGRTITYNILGDPPPLPASVDTTVYRVVQEALTNAVRYSGEASIDIQVIFSPTNITVFVDDEGPGGNPPTRPDPAGSPPPGSGHGLVGMQERLAAVGGTLEAGPKRPGPGWRVYATIPVVLLNVA